MTTVKQLRIAEETVRRRNPDIDPDIFDEAVQDLILDWEQEAARDGLPYDSPRIEDGVDNCNDWGTGEGRYHGRI